MSSLLKSIRKVDTSIKKKIPGEYFSFPPEVDLFFKWLPACYVLIANATGAKTKNSFIKRIIIITLSEAVQNSAVQFLKKRIPRRRPGSLFKLDSFPSSHTATSFSGAEILHSEINPYSPALSLTGYTVAVATAALRLYKKKHWFSDIVAGAIIGIVSAKLSQGIYTNLSR